MPKKFIKSFKCAGAGARHAFQTQRNLWIHFFVALFVLAFALWVGVNWLEFLVLVVVVFNVIAAEMFNTAMEELINILSPQHRSEAALAKNIAAAAVLVLAIGAVMVGLMVFLPRLI